MTEKQRLFLDYLLPIMSKTRESVSIGSIAHKYKKETGIEFDYLEIDQILNLYDYTYFVKHDKTVDYVKIIPEVKEYVDEFGTLSAYLLNEYEKDSAEQKKNDTFNELQSDHLLLQNEKLIHQQTIREQESIIRDYAQKNGFFQMLRNYWWLLSIIFILGGFVYKLLFT